jgi:hypothetical protein
VLFSAIAIRRRAGDARPTIRMFTVIRQVFVIAGPYIPVIGGRRKDDPPGPG